MSTKTDAFLLDIKTEVQLFFRDSPLFFGCIHSERLPVRRQPRPQVNGNALTGCPSGIELLMNLEPIAG
jgi:hypothetical protein